MEILACDFIGPLPDDNGYKYCLVIIDYFSRYPFVFPLKEITAVNTINCFKKVFAMFGFPDKVLSDQGSQFESDLFKSFLNNFKIVKTRTNAYHPAGNGLCERFNRVLNVLACVNVLN